MNNPIIKLNSIQTNYLISFLKVSQKENGWNEPKIKWSVSQFKLRNFLRIIFCIYVQYISIKKSQIWQANRTIQWNVSKWDRQRKQKCNHNSTHLWSGLLILCDY